MFKKISCFLIFFMLFIPTLKAQIISKDDIEPKTYIIGRYMYTRTPNENYDGRLTTQKIMLAARSINSHVEEDMIIYYKNVRGVWIDATNNNELSVPDEFDIEVIDLNGIFAIENDGPGKMEYPTDSIAAKTYVMGKYMYTKNSNEIYDGRLTAQKIMLASKTISGTTEGEMILYYKNARGVWIDGLNGEALEVPASFFIDVVDLIPVDGDGFEDQVPPVVTISGGTLAKSATQVLTLTCRDDSGIHSYYFGVNDPTNQDVNNTIEADLIALTDGRLEKEITSAGVYYLACKDLNGNITRNSINVVNYQVQSLLEDFDGITDNYTLDNYSARSELNSYIIRNKETVALEDLYEVIQGSEFKGYANNLGGTLSNENPSISADLTYYMLFNRNTFEVTLNGGENGTTKIETINQSNNSATVNGTSQATLTVKYGDFVKATATPLNGYGFTGWSGGYISGLNEVQVGNAVDSDLVISSSFAALDAPICTFGESEVIKVGESGSIELTCTSNIGIITNSLSAADFTLSNDKFLIDSIIPSEIEHGMKYVIHLNAISKGEGDISLKTGVVQNTNGIGNSVLTSTLKASETYTLSFDANGGTGVVNSVSCDVISEMMCEVTLPENEFENEDWNFVSWGTESSSTSGSGAGISINIAESGTRYAIWKKDEIIRTLTLNANNRTDDVIYKSCTVPAVYNGEVQGTTCEVTLPANRFVNNGWEFLAWSTSSTATSGSNPGEAILMDGPKTMYALWIKPTLTYTASFDANSGTGVTESVSCTIPAVYNGENQGTYCEVTLPENTFENTGWTFNGWTTDSSSMSGLSASNSVPLTANTTYYASWKKVVIVKFRANGCTTSNRTATMTIFNGATSGSITVPEAIMNDGWTSLGASTSEDSTVMGVPFGSTLELEDIALSETNLNAYYNCEKPAIIHTVTLVAGTENTELTCTVPAVYNGAAREGNPSCQVTLPAPPSVEGYGLGRWYNATTGIYYNANQTISIKEDITLTVSDVDVTPPELKGVTFDDRTISKTIYADSNVILRVEGSDNVGIQTYTDGWTFDGTYFTRYIESAVDETEITIVDAAGNSATRRYRVNKEMTYNYCTKNGYSIKDESRGICLYAMPSLTLNNNYTLYTNYVPSGSCVESGTNGDPTYVTCEDYLEDDPLEACNSDSCEIEKTYVMENTSCPSEMVEGTGTAGLTGHCYNYQSMEVNYTLTKVVYTIENLLYTRHSISD